MVCRRIESMDAELRPDLKTLATFVLVYCRHKHHDAMKAPVRLKTHDLEEIAGRPIRLCDECGKLLAHAITKRVHCPFDPPAPGAISRIRNILQGRGILGERYTTGNGRPKPACKNCPQHCYHPHWRKRMKEVMRFSGTKLLLTGRLDYLFHMLF